MKRKTSFILLLIAGLAFFLGIAQLFQWRFDSGDVYPPYSSLRTDPLGSSAFYESLGQFSGISVRRDYSSKNLLPTGKDVAYLHLAGESSSWNELPDTTFEEIKSFLQRGGRLVVAFYPENSEQFRSSFRRQQTAASKPKPAKKGGKAKSDDDSPRLVSLKDKWGVDFSLLSLDHQNGAYVPVLVNNKEEPALPASMHWHSGLVFTNLNSLWHVIYARDSSPVMIERKFGAGSVVLSTDSYFLSNEALQKEPHADLLAWLVNPAREIVFDEAHLGIMESQGVASLMRKYNLQGFVFGLLLLAALFIWKNSTSLVPAHADEKAAEFVAGRESATGFVNLLRRNIGTRDLLKVCLKEWEKTLGHGRFTARKLELVNEVINAQNNLPEKERNPLKAYREICRVLKPDQGTQPPPSSN